MYPDQNLFLMMSIIFKYDGYHAGRHGPCIALVQSLYLYKC